MAIIVIYLEDIRYVVMEIGFFVNGHIFLDMIVAVYVRFNNIVSYNIMMYQQDDNYLNDLIFERDRDIEQIVMDMKAINDMMQNIGVMIDEQAESIDTISTNITNSSDNCENAVVEIEKANKCDKKNNSIYWEIGIGATITTIIGVIVTSVIFS